MFCIILLAFACMCIDFTNAVQEIFDIKADDMFETMVGDVLKVKRYINKIDFEDVVENLMKQKASLKNVTHLFVTNKTNEDTKKTPTTRNQRRALPFTLQPKLTPEIKWKRDRLLKIKNLLSMTYITIPDFENDAENPDLQTRRFDMLKSKVIREETRRQQVYFDGENATIVYMNKKKVLSIMEQFIYSTRYKLTYAQKLREKYMFDLRYKIGFCMALLRVIKIQQKMLYNTLEKYLLEMKTLHVHMKIYERIVRYDVDIKDLMTFIQGIERQRKLNIDPNYYDLYYTV